MKKKIPSGLTLIISLGYYIAISLYKLVNQPIWGDEAMEYFCSILTKGPIKGFTEYGTFYERMTLIQQQPPLYNILMAPWIRISGNEWWLRFSSVIIGCFAILGIYFLVNKLYGNIVAMCTCLMFSSMFWIQYYTKEFSEYILLLVFVAWILYAFVSIIEEATRKRIIVFIILCVFAMLTQYGAIFVVSATAVLLLIFVIKEKKWSEMKTLLIGYGIAIVCIGAPLFFFFVIPQSTNTVSTLNDIQSTVSGQNLLSHFWNSTKEILGWTFLDDERDYARLQTVFGLILALDLILGVFVAVKTKKKSVRYYIIGTAIIYLMFYGITATGVYAYGDYGSRYNLFLSPIILIFAVCLVCEILGMLRECGKKGLTQLATIGSVAMIIFAGVYCLYGDYRVHNHWAKSDERSVVSAWMEMDRGDIPTFVNAKQRYSFIYYLEQNKQYDEALWDELYVNMSYEPLSYSDEEWIEYLEKEYFKDGLPEELYVVNGTVDTVVSALLNAGYQMEPIVDTTAKLYYMYKE